MYRVWPFCQIQFPLLLHRPFVLPFYLAPVTTCPLANPPPFPLHRSPLSPGICIIYFARWIRRGVSRHSTIFGVARSIDLTALLTGKLVPDARWISRTWEERGRENTKRENDWVLCTCTGGFKGVDRNCVGWWDSLGEKTTSFWWTLVRKERTVVGVIHVIRHTISIAIYLW